MASLPYPRTLYKMNMNLHTTLVSSAFFAFCLAASNAAAANNSASHPITISPSQHLTTTTSFHIHIQEVVVRILLHVQLSYLLVEHIAELLDVLLVLCRDEEAVVV